MQPIVKPMLHVPEDAYAGSKWKTEQWTGRGPDARHFRRDKFHIGRAYFPY